jgi:hypothetical protein
MRSGSHILVQNLAQEKLSLLRKNLESKGPEFLLPPRSMVLKVVTGKI